jgi:anaphase-promoting complex subunit 4
VIEAWPTLPLDLLAASVNSSSHRNSTAPGSTGFEDDVDDSNVNSILAVTDDHGRMHCFLDGSFPLGNVDIGPNLSTVCLSKDPKRPILFSHPSTGANASTVTALRPVIIDVPLLGERYVRDLAKLSSTARELSWYMLRVAEEIRTAWCGNESFTGAREFGPKWCVALKAKQANDFGRRCSMELPSLLF